MAKIKTIEHHNKMMTYYFDTVVKSEGVLSMLMITVVPTSPYHDPVLFLLHKLGMR